MINDSKSYIGSLMLSVAIYELFNDTILLAIFGIISLGCLGHKQCDTVGGHSLHTGLMIVIGLLIDWQYPPTSVILCS